MGSIIVIIFEVAWSFVIISSVASFKMSLGIKIVKDEFESCEIVINVI